MSGKQFALFKRGKYWYVQFKDSHGIYTTARSTKCINKHDAESYAISLISDGSAIISKETFGAFAKDFFSPSGAWALDRLSRGKRITERYCLYAGRNLDNNVMPFFGTMKLADIDIATIKAFRADLFKRGFSGASINMYLGIVKQVLTYAEESGLIKGVPRIDRAAKNQKNRGILTVEEVRSLFAADWDDIRGFTASLLSASTGLRLGEVLGLVIGDYHPGERYIHCHRCWDRVTWTLLPTTKTGRARNVFIPTPVIMAIDNLIAANPYPTNAGSYIFWADKSSAYPTEPKIITRSFYSAMRHIGITEEARRARNITFHSHRHFLNSLLINSNIPLQKIQSITGHLTDEMSQHYYHVDDMADVGAVTESLLTGISKK